MSAPKCFISYSDDSPKHNEWVIKLSECLQANGVEVLFDKWDVRAGSDLTGYMEASIRTADYVIMVCTPEYARKADTGIGGVGYEKCIITGELFQSISATEKFVPILRSGNKKTAIPCFIKHKVFVDFTNDIDFDKSFEDLLRNFHNVPRYRRPQLGPKPTFSTKKSNSVIEPSNPFVFCSRCGEVPGVRTTCTGLFVNHDFVSLKGKVYCTRCGEVPGKKTICTGIYVNHNFLSTK